MYQYQNPLYINKILKNKPYILKRMHPSVSRCYTSRPPPWLGPHNRKLRPLSAGKGFKTREKKPAKKIPAKKPAILVKTPQF